MSICEPDYDGLSNYTIVANTAARPVAGAARPIGRMIYQVDISMLLIWDGTDWRGVRSRAFSGTGSGGTTSGTTPLTMVTLIVPNQTVAGTLLILGHMQGVKSVAGDTFYGRLVISSTTVAESRPSTNTGTDVMFHTQYSHPISAGSGVTVTQVAVRNAGSGTLAVPSTAALNRIDAIFVPT
jgi:hypothetical protein